MRVEYYWSESSMGHREGTKPPIFQLFGTWNAEKFSALIQEVVGVQVCQGKVVFHSKSGDRGNILGND